MKIAYRLTKILLILSVILYVSGLLFYPITMALFTTEGYGSWENFFNDLFDTFIYLTPLAAIIFIPMLTLRLFLAYKLGHTDKRTFSNRMYVTLALEIVIIIIFGVLVGMVLNPNSVKVSKLTMTGRYLTNERGTNMIIVDESPIVMTDANDKDLFKDLSDGDLIIITHSEVAESYPGQTRVYSLKKKSDGSIDDISKDVLESLIEMGWIESDKKE